MTVLVGLIYALFTFVLVFVILYFSTFIFEFLFNMFSMYKFSDTMIKCRDKIKNSIKRILDKGV